MSSVCSTITTASAPRGMTPPVAMVVAEPRVTSIAGRWPQATTSRLRINRRGAGGSVDVGGAYREPIHIGAIKWRRVDVGDYVMRQHPSGARRQRHRLGR